MDVPIFLHIVAIGHLKGGRYHKSGLVGGTLGEDGGDFGVGEGEADAGGGEGAAEGCISRSGRWRSAFHARGGGMSAPYTRKKPLAPSCGPSSEPSETDFATGR